MTPWWQSIPLSTEFWVSNPSSPGFSSFPCNGAPRHKLSRSPSSAWVRAEAGRYGIVCSWLLEISKADNGSRWEPVDPLGIRTKTDEEATNEGHIEKQRYTA